MAKWSLAMGVLIAIALVFSWGYQAGQQRDGWLVDCYDGEYVAVGERCE